MIGITLGDPSGIGPEIIAETLVDVDAATLKRLRVFGDGCVLQRAFDALGATIPSGLSVVDNGTLVVGDVPLGTPTAAGAAAQIAYLEAAVTEANAGTLAGLVTAPINKKQVASAGFSFPGHTEFLAARLNADRVAMMFAGPKLNVVLATIHIPLVEVSTRLTQRAIIDAAELGMTTLRDKLGFPRPRVGIVGLNPHAGEAGMMGNEELETIEPAVRACRERFGDVAEVSGPVVPDAAFRQAVAGEFDLLVAMYHDQGLIPIKVVDFEHTVNCTLGLPVVRTSPDHGTAYDIAGRGIARSASFGAALRLALRMVDGGR